MGKAKRKQQKKQQKTEAVNDAPIVVNKKARFNYEVLESLETGIELVGSEVKALRNRQANISDSFARVKDNEIFVINLHISPYKQANRFNHEPTREKKLLLHKKEITRFYSKVKEKGLTLVPLKMYFKNGKVKLLLGLCQGKRVFDKREDLKERDTKRDLERAMKKYESR